MPRRKAIALVRVVVASTALGLALTAIPGCSDDGDASSPSASGSSSSAALDSIRQRLNDRIFEFGRSSGNSDRNAHLTGIHQLQLCKVGRFGWKETTSFSSSVGSMTSESLHQGTWTLQSVDGQVVVDLKVESSTAKNPPDSQRFFVTVGDDGVRFDGASTTQEGDATADCEAAASSPR